MGVDVHVKHVTIECVDEVNVSVLAQGKAHGDFFVVAVHRCEVETGGVDVPHALFALECEVEGVVVGVPGFVVLAEKDKASAFLVVVLLDGCRYQGATKSGDVDADNVVGECYGLLGSIEGIEKDAGRITLLLLELVEYLLFMGFFGKFPVLLYECYRVVVSLLAGKVFLARLVEHEVAD